MTMRGRLRGAAALVTVGGLFLTGCLAPLVSVSPDRARWAVVLDGGGNPRVMPSCWAGLLLASPSSGADPEADSLLQAIANRLCREDKLYLYDPDEGRLESVEPPERFQVFEAAWDPQGRGVLLLGAVLSSPIEELEGEFRVYRYSPEQRSWELLARIAPPPSPSGRFPFPEEPVFVLPRSPSLSPDGRWMAYVLQGGGVFRGNALSELWIVDRATGERVESVPGVLAYEWLPNGSSLVAWRMELDSLLETSGAEGQLLEVNCNSQGCSVGRTLRSLAFPRGSPERVAMLMLLYAILPPTQFFDLAPDGSEVALIAFAVRGGEAGAPLEVEGRLHVIPLREEVGREGFVRRGALLPRYSPSGRSLAAVLDARVEFRRRPDPNAPGACLAAPTPFSGDGFEPPLDPDLDPAYVCLDPGNFLALWERTPSPSSSSSSSGPLPTRTIELAHAPLELFWVASKQLGYAYSRGLRVGLRLVDLETGASEDLTDRLRAAWEALPVRILRVPEDYPRVQAAVDAARPGDVVRLAPGVYAEDLVLTREIVLEALPGGGEGDGEGQGVEIRGRVRIVALTPREIVLRNVRLVGGRGLGTGLEVLGPVSLTLEGVTVAGHAGHGIVLRGGSGRGSVELQLRLREVRVRGNRACGLWVAVEGARVIAAEPIEMRDNGVDLCGYAPVTIRKPLTPPTERTRVRVPQDYPTLQEAVDAVAPGGVVELSAPRISTDEVGGATLGKPLTLRGGDGARTALVAERRRGGILLSVPAGVAGVRIEGLSLVLDPEEGQGLWVYGEATLKGVHVRTSSQPRDGRDAGSGLVGLRADGRARVRLERVGFSGLETGILARGEATLELEDVGLVGTPSRPPAPWFHGVGLDVGGRVRLTARGLTLQGLDRAILVCEAESDCRPTLELTDLRVEGVGGALRVQEEADVRVRGGLIRDASGFLSGAVHVEGSAVLRLEETRILGDGKEFSGPGLVARVFPFSGERRARVVLKDVLVSGYEVGLLLKGRVEVTIEDSEVAENRTDGLVLDGSGLPPLPLPGRLPVRIVGTEIRENGTSDECRRVETLCVGVELRGAVDLELVDTAVRGNADWGIAAHLRLCGYPEDEFSGRVDLLGNTRVEGNNTAGNHSGEICLP